MGLVGGQPDFCEPDWIVDLARDISIGAFDMKLKAVDRFFQLNQREFVQVMNVEHLLETFLQFVFDIV